uniref:Uncharacterized protein n=1 Tax=Candidatus Kentrum sp. FW TaxID=2126338 RepID=A0A450TBY6_9GAMM|nr:MAG: hypothetical protein BECKFW1821A_GA0114235_10644 [Candidatus Kentron sp. FW]VFJ64249.1 MAG: hypothetical protein BECKFW1821B_GA0114236_109211 [Candidatus Kentron sp. FW]
MEKTKANDMTLSRGARFYRCALQVNPNDYPSYRGQTPAPNPKDYAGPVIDQPEDDLDNRFISEYIVPRMKQEKRRRQFLFASHNANIPVLGDAELIIGLSTESDEESGRISGLIEPEHAGAIDNAPVRRLVEEILEGGRDAFSVRREKYGF